MRDEAAHPRPFKTVLAQPLWPRSVEYGRFKKGAANNSFAYGMASIAAVAEAAGFDVAICDSQSEDLSEEAFMARMRAQAPAVVGIPCYTPSVPWVFRTAALCKLAVPNCKVVTGGAHVTIQPAQMLHDCPDIDVAVAGEGEYPFRDLLRLWRDGTGEIGSIPGVTWRAPEGIRTNLCAANIRDLDELPMPAYHLFPMEKYVFGAHLVKSYPTYGMVTTRGCPYRCTFCDATRVHGKKLRHRSIDNIIAEIDLLKRRYGTRGVVFQDSTFTIHKKWVHQFCDALIARKVDINWSCGARSDSVDPDLLRHMREAGCWQVYFGLESANQKSLDLIKKNTTVEENIAAVEMAQAAGMFVGATYILGLPGETEADVENTIAMARRLATHYAFFFLPVPFPGSELWDACRADGGLREDADWGDYLTTDFSRPVYVNPLLGRDRMKSLYDKAYRSYYRNPTVLWRNFRTIRSPQDIAKYWQAVRAVVGI